MSWKGSTLPPAFNILSNSPSFPGLWSSDNGIALQTLFLYLAIIALESPTFAHQSLFPKIKQLTVVVPEKLASTGEVLSCLFVMEKPCFIISSWFFWSWLTLNWISRFSRVIKKMQKTKRTWKIIFYKIRNDMAISSMSITYSEKILWTVSTKILVYNVWILIWFEWIIWEFSCPCFKLIT